MAQPHLRTRSNYQLMLQIILERTTHTLARTVFRIQEGHCSICLEDTPATIVQLNNCGHIFHVQCLGKWVYLSFNNSRCSRCPMCRGYIFDNRLAAQFAVQLTEETKHWVDRVPFFLYTVAVIFGIVSGSRSH
jgi:hypothetical protein